MAVRSGELVQERPGASLRASFDRLQQLTTLAPNWDSYGALPPTGEAIWTAGRLIVAVADEQAPSAETKALPWAIAPFSEGILLEWRADEAALEIHIDGQGRLGYLRERRGADGPAYDEGDDITFAEALAFVRDVLGKERGHHEW